MASPLLPDQSLHADRRLPRRYVRKALGGLAGSSLRTNTPVLKEGIVL
jgi:hypothetical protein